MDAGVWTARGIGELHRLVQSLAKQGYRIVTVFDTLPDNYHVVFQKEASRESLCEDEGCPHYGIPHICVNNNKKG